MSEVLKKIPKERDVQRMRNLITKKYGDKTIDGVGYQKAEEFHKEGDVWEENDRTWTIKNGIRQNLTKLDQAKKETMFPLFCGCCSKIMNHKYDKEIYLVHKRCFNCQISFENEIKIKGLWEVYEKSIVNPNIDFLISELEVWYEELLNQGNENIIYENGDIETWYGSVKEELLQNREKAIEFLQKLKK